MEHYFKVSKKDSGLGIFIGWSDTVSLRGELEGNKKKYWLRFAGK